MPQSNTTVSEQFFIVPIRMDSYATFFIFLFMVDYDNLKFTLLISASSRTFSRRQSAAIELFTAAATFSVFDPPTHAGEGGYWPGHW